MKDWLTSLQVDQFCAVLRCKSGVMTEASLLTLQSCRDATWVDLTARADSIQSTLANLGLKKGSAHPLSGMAKCVALAANSRPGGNIVTGAAIADKAANLAGSTYFTDMLRDASSSWRGLIDGSGASSSSGI
jgi:hypothetical protein